MSGHDNRLEWVDVAKGLSIILVVMMHSAFGVGEETGSAGALHWVIAFATPFRMPEFFLISGLFLSLVIARDWRAYADRRVVHYLYFYALWAVLHIVFKVGLGSGDPITAASYLAWAVIEPYGVLWFIYILAVFSAATKLLWQLRIPHWLALPAAAVLNILPVSSGIYVLNQVAEYFVFFYAGYCCAPLIFRMVAWAEGHASVAAAGVVTWAVVNGALVFSPGFEVLPSHVQMGLAAMPDLHLALSLAGAAALCVSAGLLAKLPAMAWLGWLGSNSIVVYLAFAIPMAVTRVVLLKLGVITDTSVLSILVMVSAIVAPLVLCWVVARTGKGRFLFERPAWAHLPGTYRSRLPQTRIAQAPAA